MEATFTVIENGVGNLGHVALRDYGIMDDGAQWYGVFIQYFDRKGYGYGKQSLYSYTDHYAALQLFTAIVADDIHTAFVVAQEADNVRSW